MFNMLNGGGDGGGVGEGVCSGGGGGGGVDGWCVHGKPCVISWTTLHGKVISMPSSLLTRGSISGLYSGPDFSQSLKIFPLHIAPNIKEMAYFTY